LNETIRYAQCLWRVICRTVGQCLFVCVKSTRSSARRVCVCVTVCETGSLQIRHSQESDEGKYECVAENSVGVAYSYAANLYVRGECTHCMPHRGGREGRGKGPCHPPQTMDKKLKLSYRVTHIDALAVVMALSHSMTIKQLTNIATLRHFRHMTTQKSVKLQGASPPDLLTRGSAPGSRWGHSPQTPVIGLHSAVAIWAYMVPQDPQSLLLDPPLMPHTHSMYAYSLLYRHTPLLRFVVIHACISSSINDSSVAKVWTALTDISFTLNFP